jgi:hypothetical protein
LELEAFLDEALPIAAMAEIEKALREDPTMLERLAQVNAKRDAGVHTLGSIWRVNRLSCPTRQDLGSYLLGVLEPPQADYLQFHLTVAGCRTCQANLDDLRSQQQEAAPLKESRRRKYFQSSAGGLAKG